LSDDGQTLALTGSIELGTTRRLEQMLADAPTIKEIVLASHGGNIFEARGLSTTIRQHGLNTVVNGECSSACTTIFIGGIERVLTPGARLGFHQYRVAASYAVLGADPAQEQARDREIFLASGVAGWFLDEMFQSAASQIWYPTRSELIRAHVVTGPTSKTNEN
jgi:hypothetical protein